MLVLKRIPSVDHQQVEIFYSKLSFRDKLKHVFSSRAKIPSIYEGKKLYEDVLVFDPDNMLILGQKHETMEAVYTAKEPDLHKMINHTVYTLSGVTPYGIMDDAKLCSVDRFDIEIDRCWKSNY